MIHSDLSISARLEAIRQDVQETGRRAPHAFNANAIGGLLTRLEQIDRDIQYLIQDIEHKKTEVQ